MMCKTTAPMMASLPPQRLQPSNPPFTSMGFDYFGPFQLAPATDPEKLAAISMFQHPDRVTKKGKHLKYFICSYCRRHIFQFATRARPLYHLIKDDIPYHCGKEQEGSFVDLKATIETAPLLAYPNYTLPIEIIPDAGGYGIGGVLASRLAYLTRLKSIVESQRKNASPLSGASIRSAALSRGVR